MKASELTNPSIIKVSKSDLSNFWYGKEKFEFTGCFCVVDTEIRHIASGDESWLSRDSAVYEEIQRQSDIICKERAVKEKARREAKQKKLLELMKDSNMTAIEWRIKLLKEHGLLLTSRPYGNDYEVYKCNTKWNDSFVVTSKTGKQNLDVKTIMQFCESKKITNADPYHRFNEITIKEVLDKVIRIQRKEMDMREKEIIKAINSLAG